MSLTREANRNSTEFSNQGTELNKFWWLYLPIGFYFFRYIGHFIGDENKGLSSLLRYELGIVETLTVIVLALALTTTISIIIRYGRSLSFVVNVFLVLYCLGCIYFAGEEASWGQHWFGWETNEFFMQHNDQGETNLHNTMHLFDRTPKGIISGLILLGGVILPLWFSYKQVRLSYSQKFWWVIPTWICLPTAVITSIATLPAKLEDEIGFNFYFEEAQETKECFIAYFILLYIVSLAKRLSHLHENKVEFSPI